MARPKEFDVDAALDRAMDVFWEHGFEAASLKSLVDRMGIGRQSLYDTFGDKRSLYMAALERYRRAIGQPLLAILEEPGASLDAIRAVFELAIEYSCGGESGRICFLIQSSLERSGDPEVTALVRRHYGRIIETLQGCIDNARRKGELQHRSSAEPLARALGAQIIGISVLGRAGFPRETLADGIRALLEAPP